MTDMRPEILAWLEVGKEKGATHMLVTCDRFSDDFAPVYVLPDQNVFLVADAHRTDPSRMHELTEVYSYALPLEQQLAGRRSLRYDVTTSPPARATVNLEELSQLAQHAGTLERLLQLPGSLLTHPHWRPAVQACVAKLNALYAETLAEAE